ncbi:DUF4362 domain-containing protein [Paenibacillus qinlingensis]|uniref:DUF4362 domain-containing protein n=1 Tax=Paenibacillus qinlingensis TaxID=1837343 RepID=A0ABU1NYP2_9BACL|nr:DUF4362 domain-containing protein [Paenibacillus qinlingensis]MDR6552595.1 hypothetical protein [Paenibacillus qinlingensis]
MKLINYMIVLVALSMLVGCAKQQKNGDMQISYKINEKEDVINSHGIIVKNREKLDAFINKTNSTQRVVHYTIEGDPIFNDLTYKDNKYEMRNDTTKDKFGSPLVKTCTCAKLERNETDKFLKYTLSGCDGDRKEIEVLQIPFDVENQDTFEFDLRYGVNQKNEINTINNNIVKDLQNGEVTEVSDFHFNKEDRQKIYKEMVLANYLGDKELSNKCNRNPYVSYDLTVHINSGKRHYHWTECDSNEDGKMMTKLANAIIEIVQANDIYKQLPAVKGQYL